MIAYRPGQLVDCLFPFDEAPDRPGPTPHVVYIQRRLADAQQAYAMVFYTTTVPRPANQPRRAGTIEVPLANAKAMGMERAFTIDTRRIGILPLRADFFPGLEAVGNGIRGVAPERLALALTRLLADGIREAQQMRVYRTEFDKPEPRKS